jgi:hypothetical protein
LATADEVIQQRMTEGHLTVRPVMSGSTSSGPGPNCAIDVMGQ